MPPQVLLTDKGAVVNRVRSAGGLLTGVWPTVAYNDWCGVFKQNV